MSEALGRIGIHSREVTSVLLNALSYVIFDRDMVSVFKTLSDLGAYPAEAIEALLAEMLTRRGGTLIMHLFDPAILGFGLQLPTRGDWLWLPATYLVELGKRHPGVAIPMLLTTLTEGNAYDQEIMAWALGEIGEGSPDVVGALASMEKPWWEDIYESLVQVRADPDIWHQGAFLNQRRLAQLAISEALAKLGLLNRKNRRALVVSMSHRSSHEVRRIAAMRAISALSEKRHGAVKHLLDFLLDESEETRTATLKTLESLGTDDRKIAAAIIRQLGAEHKWKTAVKTVGALTHKLDRKAADEAIYKLRSLLADVESDASDDVYDALDRVAARQTELEVGSLRAGPPPFVVESSAVLPRTAILICLGVILATLSGLGFDILAAYLQKEYDLLTEPLRILAVAAVSVLTLIGSIWATLRLEKA